MIEKILEAPSGEQESMLDFLTLEKMFVAAVIMQLLNF